MVADGVVGEGSLVLDPPSVCCVRVDVAVRVHVELVVLS